MTSIPFNRPGLEGDELVYLAQAIKSGISSAKGPWTRRASDLLREAIECEEVLLTTSCTTALEMAAMLLDLEPEENVIVPSFTFVTTASAFERERVQLRFADIEPTTLGLDPASVADLLDDRTRAVVPVHYAGVAPDMKGLERVLADRPDIDVIEDNAHGLFGSHGGQPLGSLGRMSALSFHETKNFVCGEGGALCINDPADVDRAHVLYDKGTNRRAFFQGDVDKYSWIDRGSSFGLSDMLAAFLVGQLERKDTILAKRGAVWRRYHDAIAPQAEGLGLTLPWRRPDDEPTHHMFYVLLPTAAARTRVLHDLREDGVHATFHYVPLHSAAGRRFTDRPTPCPVTDDISSRLLRLPFYNDLLEEEQDRVIESFLTHARRAVTV